MQGSSSVFQLNICAKNPPPSDTQIRDQGEALPLRTTAGLAKDNGLTEAELVGVITHLAFYTGWPRAMTAIMIAKEMFEQDK